MPDPLPASRLNLVDPDILAGDAVAAIWSDRFQQDGMIPKAGDADRLTALLGRPLRHYREFAAQLAGVTP